MRLFFNMNCRCSAGSFPGVKFIEWEIFFAKALFNWQSETSERAFAHTQIDTFCMNNQQYYVRLKWKVRNQQFDFGAIVNCNITCAGMLVDCCVWFCATCDKIKRKRERAKYTQDCWCCHCEIQISSHLNGFQVKSACALLKSINMPFAASSVSLCLCLSLWVCVCFLAFKF